jgi:hypothetical protein
MIPIIAVLTYYCLRKGKKLLECLKIYIVSGWDLTPPSSVNVFLVDDAQMGPLAL